MVRILPSLAAFALPLLVPGTAAAALVMDGTVDLDYGAPVAVQSVQTQFGDATNPAGTGSGGELDAAYGRIEGGRLFITVTGNIEPNFNTLSVFIDSKAGGENTLAPLGYGFNNNAANLGGLAFDTGVNVDYHIFALWGGGALEVSFVDRQGGTVPLVATGSATSGAGTGIQAGSFTGGPLGSSFDFGFNNTNIAGVAGGTEAADQSAAAAVMTGFEFSLSLLDLGHGGGDIRVVAAYGNGDHNFFSNQVLGGLSAGTGNLGGDGAGGFTGNSGGIDFNDFSGDQYFTVPVPEPSVALLGMLGLAGFLRRRR